MKVSTVALALSGGASALPAFSNLVARQPTDLTNRKVEFKGAEAPSLIDDMTFSRAKTVAVRDEVVANTGKRSLVAEPREAAAPASDTGLRTEAIGDNKENPTTGLTDSDAAEIVTSIDFSDKQAPGSLNAKGQRNPLPGLTAEMTDAIINQGQAALKEAGA
ncbi:hypothetical protein CGRA01v4_04296 [Colletotrichum graminicola]|uniref:Uncharacterized protein n=1 Tax=Colletotrichum graminicola (strain M1.001 / M2 / FGSC 10212) TaxID=645133 RepID=E3Q961_COLGM|nr:uncharacterized protein GLRG_01735 [Colletotrichum graminicola M1.001]EFQ27240.1 hypothetical protein GLRG_01735 [Colletotrichum graminicola M1.001]WDK13015.1 hypothetical protein CGRA01v4_04296 [Colletotrichum graminicola]